jgi:hypothetical protein
MQWGRKNNCFILRVATNIAMSIVDAWSLYDNNDSLKLIANADKIVDQVKFENIRQSCQNKNV